MVKDVVGGLKVGRNLGPSYPQKMFLKNSAPLDPTPLMKKV